MTAHTWQPAVLPAGKPTHWLKTWRLIDEDGDHRFRQRLSWILQLNISSLYLGIVSGARSKTNNLVITCCMQESWTHDCRVQDLVNQICVLTFFACDSSSIQIRLQTLERCVAMIRLCIGIQVPVRWRHIFSRQIHVYACKWCHHLALFHWHQTYLYIVSAGSSYPPPNPYMSEPMMLSMTSRNYSVTLATRLSTFVLVYAIQFNWVLNAKIGMLTGLQHFHEPTAAAFVKFVWIEVASQHYPTFVNMQKSNIHGLLAKDLTAW